MGIDLIMISGIKRSASTAQWNLVRLALEMARYEVLPRGHSFDLQELNSLNDNEVILCKRHPFHKAMAKAADHIFLTDRPDEEIIASLNRMWDSGSQERVDRMRKDLKAWKEYSDIPVFWYEDFVLNEMNWIAGVVYYLDLDFSIDKVIELLEKFEAIEPPEDEYDPITLLFPDHISDV